MASDPTYPAFPVLSFLGACLLLIPLPWHFQAFNSGTCLYMIWTALGLLNLSINSIVWRSTAINYAPVWCDICKTVFWVIQAVELTFYSLSLDCRSRGCYTRRVSVSIDACTRLPLSLM
jgi:pheromone a factor receptor